MTEAEQKFQKRQTAYKVEINDIINSKYIKNEGLEPNYLEIGGKEVSRINLMGVVVLKSDLENYNTLFIDDGTGKISARIFENKFLLDKINVSDVVLIIGKPREFSSEKYVLIETIKKIDPAWAKVRRLELKKIERPANNPPTNNNSFDDSVIDFNPKNKILKLIKELDKGNGVSIGDISSRGTGDVDKIIDNLLKVGDIFEVKPGWIKVLE